MLGSTQPTWLSPRPVSQVPGSEKLPVPPACEPNSSTVRHVGYGAGVAPSFVGRVIKAACALAIVAILILGSSNSLFSCSRESLTHLPSTVVRSLSRSVKNTTTPLLQVFQVYPPVLTVAPDGSLEITDGSSNATVEVGDSGKPTCEGVVAIYSFANSYGAPFVGQYSPPSCSFNRVTWNLTVVSAGRQYDRLGIVYLGDIEVFRTSTAEPTADGIRWTYLKDMTSYLSLFANEQTVIFDLGNLINDVYTAPFNVTLTAAYFTATDTITPADLILPVSARKASQNMPSVFQVPPDTASNALTFPQNVRKAVFTIAATGQSEEEFWWSNVLQSDVDTYPGTTLYGYSPFREVQLYIDGVLAGVAWPFPIIFTGGVVPGLWRPIVGIDAFDLKEDEIDISPFLPILCDGKTHNFTIRVSGLNDDGNGHAVLSETTDSYWLVTGKVFIWLDEEGHVTTGDGPTKETPAPTFLIASSIGQTANATNGTLLYHVSASRELSFHSTLHLSTGKESVSWQQSLLFSNDGNFSAGGNVEANTQSTSGVDISSSGYIKSYEYPLYAYSVFASLGENISISAIVNRGKQVKTLGSPVFPTGLESFSPAAQAIHQNYPKFEGAWLETTQNGSATYLANETAQTSFSYGTTEQEFDFRGIETHASPAVYAHHHSGFPPVSGSTELFHRYVKAVNSTVVEDDEVLLGRTFEPNDRGARGQGDGRGFLLTNVPGRGGHWRSLRGPPGQRHH